jgi:hypothetical protein
MNLLTHVDNWTNVVMVLCVVQLLLNSIFTSTLRILED